MPIFKVELELTMIVEADSAELAEAIALKEAKNEELSFIACCNITHLSELSGGWDGSCLPYGGDEKTCLYEILIHDEKPFYARHD
jgi:hypothetical protein